MNDQFSNDLFSAYFDGELTPEERERADEMLAESTDAQQELNEYGELSNLLKSLPSNSLPDEFRVEFMQAAERESLIPSGDAMAAHSKSQYSRSGWRYGFVAMAVSAAAIVIMVRAFDNQPALEDGNPHSPAVTSTTTNRSEFGQETGAAVADLAVAAENDDSSVVMRGAAKNQARADAEAATAGTPSQPKREAAASTATEAPSTNDSANAGNAQPQSKSTDLVFNLRRLNDARVGDIVEAFDTSGGTIAVVTLTVVDRRDGLKELQLLLARNKIPIEPADERGLSDFELANAKQLAATDRLTAVFVETDQTQLASALRDLQKQEVFRDLQIEQPIQIASLDALAKAQIGFFQRNAGTDRFAKPGPVPKADAAPAASAPAEDSPVNKAVAAKKKRSIATRRSIQQQAGRPKLAKSTKESDLAKRNQPAKTQLAAKQPAGKTADNKPSDGKAVDGISRQRSLSVQRKLFAVSRDRLERQKMKKAAQQELKRASSSAADALADSIRKTSDEATASRPRKAKTPAAKPESKTVRRLKILFVLVQDDTGTPPAAGKPTKQIPKAKAAPDPREEGAA